MTDTIHYAGREWREPEIWELCGALVANGTTIEISCLGTHGDWGVRLSSIDTMRTLAMSVGNPGPSPWPALRAAVLALNSERENA